MSQHNLSSVIAEKPGTEAFSNLKSTAQRGERSMKSIDKTACQRYGGTKKRKVYMGMETASGTYDSENRSVEEMTRYLNGLKRYTEKRILIYMDGKLSGQREWRNCLKFVRMECSIWEIMSRRKAAV